MKLYQITQEFQTIFNEVDENGELNEQAFAKLEENSQLMENKIIAVASYIKNLDAEREAVSQAKKLMAERESRLNKRADWLTDYLQRNMVACGISEIASSPYFTIKLKKCPVSVDILDESAIPASYFKIKEVKTLDKLTIKDCLAKGIEIPGASLKNNMRLEIK